MAVPNDNADPGFTSLWSQAFATGFGPWAAVSPALMPTRFNPVPSSTELAFSNRNLTVMQNGSSDAVAFTTFFFGSGNFYWEVLDVADGGQFKSNRVGVASLSATSGDAVGNSYFGIGLDMATGRVFWNGLTQTTTISCSPGDKMSIAVQAGAQNYIFFRTISSGTPGAWNGLTSASPVTGVGAINFGSASLAGHFMCPAVSETATATQLVGNFTGPFVGDVPLGYRAPTTYGTPPILNILTVV